MLAGVCDLARFLSALLAADNSNTVDADKHDVVFKRLQSVMLSSVSHLRKVFRDLDVGSVGAITLPEVRQLLHRHNLDAGFTDADIVAFMARFPPASPTALAAVGAGHAISWRGFLDAVIEADTLAPKDVDTVSRM